MRAKLTSKGQITIPIAIRRRLNLHSGQELEFDPKAPYLKATKVINEKRMRGVVGLLKGEIKDDTRTILNKTRGAVDLP